MIIFWVISVIFEWTELNLALMGSFIKIKTLRSVRKKSECSRKIKSRCLKSSLSFCRNILFVLSFFFFYSILDTCEDEQKEDEVCK